MKLAIVGLSDSPQMILKVRLERLEAHAPMDIIEGMTY